MTISSMSPQRYGVFIGKEIRPLGDFAFLEYHQAQVFKNGYFEFKLKQLTNWLDFSGCDMAQIGAILAQTDAVNSLRQLELKARIEPISDDISDEMIRPIDALSNPLLKSFLNH